MNTEQAEVTVIPDRPRDSQTSDSDSDGPILYRDEEEEEEEDEYTTSMAFVYVTHHTGISQYVTFRTSLTNILEKLLTAASSAVT